MLPWARGGAGLFDNAVELTLEGEGPRRHELSVRCRRRAGDGVATATGRVVAKVTPFYTHFEWLAPQVARDNATRGNWVGRYGRRGHVLFGGCDNVHNGTALPTGMSVSPVMLNPGCWSSNAKGAAKEASALQPPPGSVAQAPRTLGALHTNGAQPGAVDISLKPGVAPPCFNVSLYFCDWDGSRSVFEGTGNTTTRRAAVDLLALPKREVAWATTVLAETGAFPLGEYVTYEVCDARLAAGIRIRLYNIIGDNAVLSAVFFD